MNGEQYFSVDSGPLCGSRTAHSSSFAGPLHIKDTPMKCGNNLSAQQLSISHKEPIEDKRENSMLTASSEMQRNLTSNFLFLPYPCFPLSYCFDSSVKKL